MAQAGIGTKAAIQIGVAGLVRALLLFAPAGTVAWWPGWAFVVTQAAFAVVAGRSLAKDSPELLEERKTAAKKAKDWDKALVLATIGILPQAQLVVAGLDVRWHGTDRLGTVASLVGLAVMIASQLFVFWAMRVNPFFSSFARIQEERRHSVAHEGPYRYVRHPGYLGFILAGLSTGVLLGSAAAVGIGAVIGVLDVVRTALEDRMLRTGLKGYGEYAERVRYRLLPYVW